MIVISTYGISRALLLKDHRFAGGVLERSECRVQAAGGESGARAVTWHVHEINHALRLKRIRARCRHIGQHNRRDAKTRGAWRRQATEDGCRVGWKINTESDNRDLFARAAAPGDSQR